MRRARWVVAVGLLVLAAGCGGGEVPPTTPTTPPTAGGGPDGGVQVQRQGFEAGGGSGIVASRTYPGVLWAIRDRGAQDRPGKPRNALYAYKVSGGRVGEVADGARFKAIPLPAPARDAEDIGRDGEATSGSPTSATTSVTATTPPCSRCASQTRRILARPSC